MIRIGPALLENALADAPAFTPVPQVVGVEITGRCNLRCRHCFNDSGPDNEQELDLAMLIRLLDEMTEWGVRQLRVSGGEPTLHRGFRDLIAMCQARGISVWLNTNGIYSASMLAYLETAPIEMFLVSLDGLEERNDAIRGAGSFQRTRRSIAALGKAGQRVMIAFHVGRSSAGDVTGLAELASALQVDLKVSPIRPVGRAVRELPGEVISPEAYHQLVLEIGDLRRRFPQIRISTDFDILEDEPSNDCQRRASGDACKAGRSMVNINYDGGIYPCAFFVTPDREFAAGNLAEQSIGEVWRRPETFSALRLHQKSPTCQSCNHYKGSCAGGCPALAHAATGRLDAHDPTCFTQLVASPRKRPA